MDKTNTLTIDIANIDNCDKCVFASSGATDSSNYARTFRHYCRLNGKDLNFKYAKFESWDCPLVIMQRVQREQEKGQ